MSDDKSSGVAAVLSFFVPGLGHIYCGKIKKGLGVLFLFYMSLGITIVESSSWDPSSALIILFGSLAFLLWAVSIYDSHKIASKTAESEPEDKSKERTSSSIETLKQRLAEGEISEEEFEKKKGILQEDSEDTVNEETEPRPSTGDEGIYLECKKLFLQFLITNNPICMINGEEKELNWKDETFIPLEPNKEYKLSVYFPYFGGEGGRNDFKVSVSPGETKSFIYHVPFLVHMRGRIKRK